MSAVRTAALLAAALAMAAPAHAQRTPPAAPAQDQAGQDVVVTGTADREQEIRDFVGALTGQVPMTGQLARFEEAICPGVYGLSDQLKGVIAARMRRVAAEVGLRVADQGCRPNLLLMVTRDKVTFLRRLASRYPQFFDEEENSPRRVTAQPGPVAAWHATIALNADGQPISVQGGFGVNRTTRSQSRVTAPARPAFVAAAIVVESGALVGLSAIQLADYALMRGLARTDPHDLPPNSPPTILSAIEAPMGSAVPITITRWDLGFLRGLYATPSNLRAPQQRGEIQRQVASELERREGGRN